MRDKGGTGRLSTTNIDVKIQQAQETIRENWRFIIDAVVHSLQINHGSANQIIYSELGFHKVCAKSIPKEITVESRRKRIEVYQRLFDR